MTEDQERYIPTVSDNSPAAMIQIALARGADLDKLERLLDLQLKWETNEAKKHFDEAFARVHASIPAVVKTEDNKQTSSKYAPLDAVIEKTKPIYTAEGFSVTFYEGITDKPEHTRLCADVAHRLGYTKTYWYDCPPEGTGIQGKVNMTKTHAKASQFSYGRRYLMCMIWNIPTPDDDGNQAGEKSITTDQTIEINDLINETGADRAKFLKYIGAESVEQIAASQYNKALAALKAKKQKAPQREPGQEG